MRYITILLAFVLLLSFATAQQQTLGTFKQGEPINLLQTCSNCTYVNISAVQNPNSNIILSNVLMTKIGSSYNYTIGSQNILGTYTVCGIGDLNGVNDVWCYSFDITADGVPIGNFSPALFLAIGAISLFILGYLMRLNSLLILGGTFMIVFGVVTLYPGYGFTNYDSLVGLTIGTCCIAAGFLMMLLPNFKKSEYEEVEVEYED
jgi:hypothetical protein